jgi:DNA-binding transcriptional MerR regulator
MSATKAHRKHHSSGHSEKTHPSGPNPSKGSTSTPSTTSAKNILGSLYDSKKCESRKEENNKQIVVLDAKLKTLKGGMDKKTQTLTHRKLEDHVEIIKYLDDIGVFINELKELIASKDKNRQERQIGPIIGKLEAHMGYIKDRERDIAHVRTKYGI